MMFALRNIFAVPKNFLKLKNYCTFISIAFYISKEMNKAFFKTWTRILNIHPFQPRNSILWESFSTYRAFNNLQLQQSQSKHSGKHSSFGQTGKLNSYIGTYIVNTNFLIDFPKDTLANFNANLSWNVNKLALFHL